MAANYKEIVEKVNDAFATGNNEAFLDLCAEDVVWTIVGDQAVDGRDAIREFIKQTDGGEGPKFTVTQVVAGEDSAVGYGQMDMKEPDGCEGSYEYCDVYRFNAEGKIAELRTFMIKLK